jgi:uncharacterized protein (TIGR03083 family)
MDVDAAIDVLAAQGRLLGDAARKAGTDAPVPSCPGWTVGDLVRHMGLVHRWATANVVAAGPYVEESGIEAALTYPRDEDLDDWLREGLRALTQTLDATPDEQPCWTFFGGETGRRFWIRRQLHETAVHRMDAELAAVLPLSPLPTDIAVDGIDELLTGFVPRPRSRLRSQQPWAVAVQPVDVHKAWTVRVSAEPPVTVRDLLPADATVRGPANDLYAFLWNRRTDGVTVEGDPAIAGRWRDGVQIQW